MVKKPADYKDSFSIFCEGAKPCGQQQQQQLLLLQTPPPPKGSTMCFGSRGSITSGGAGEPFSPGRAPQPPPPPQMFIRGGGGLGGWLGLGWVGASKSQNPPAPYNEAWFEVGQIRVFGSPICLVRSSRLITDAPPGLTCPVLPHFPK